MYPVSNNNLNRDNDKEIYFFTTAFHPFDNFSAHVVRIWDKKFLTAEHAFQWKKFSKAHPDIAEEIFNADSPDIVKNISLLHKDKVEPSWHDRKVQIMKDILTEKVKQHKDVRGVLKKSGSRKIIENSPVDSFWGIGEDGKGENVLGKIWMEVRDELL